MSERIELSTPLIGGNEWKYLKDCLDTGWVSSVGPYVDRFEQQVAEFCGCRYAIATSSGTAALHTALLIVGVEADDEVLVPALTFIAPVNAVHYLNAHPVFMDCDDFYNMDVSKVLEFIENETIVRDGYSYNKSTGRRLTAIVPVHVFGNAVDLSALLSICRSRNIKIVEDATESLGTRYSDGELKGRYTGAVGDIGCFSFNGNKIITCGGGGMIVTDNSVYAKRAKHLTTQAKEEGIHYFHHEVGYNYRLTNIQAALGVAQLEVLPEYLKRKRENFRIYQQALENVKGVTLANVPGYAANNYWMYGLQVEGGAENRDALIAFLAKVNIQARPIWELNHRQKPYLHCQAYQIKKAVELHAQTVNIPCSVHLTPVQIKRVVEQIKEFK